MIKFHRWVYCYYNNKEYSDKSFVVRHLCHNKNCINLSHLKAGTLSENQLDSRQYKKGTIITEKLVHALLKDSLKQNFSVMGSKKQFDEKWANKTGLSASSIPSIRNGKNWKDLYILYYPNGHNSL